MWKFGVFVHKSNYFLYITKSYYCVCTDMSGEKLLVRLSEKLADISDNTCKC